jgi:hypothetical protein
MHNAALIAQRHVASRQHVVGDRLPEHLDAQYICYDFLSFALNVRVHEGNVVVATYYVAEGWETLFNPLYLDGVGYWVAQMLQFLVRRGRGHEQAALVACGQAANYACSGDCGVADGDYVLQFGFEDTTRGLGWHSGGRQFAHL